MALVSPRTGTGQRELEAEPVPEGRRRSGSVVTWRAANDDNLSVTVASLAGAGRTRRSHRGGVHHVMRHEKLCCDRCYAFFLKRLVMTGGAKNAAEYLISLLDDQ